MLIEPFASRDPWKASVRRNGWVALRLVVPFACLACVGSPPAPPQTETTEDASGTVSAHDTTATATSRVDTTAGSEEPTGGAASGTQTSSGPASECGNGEVDPGEECDGTDWQGATCESLGYHPGTLDCASGCTYDASRCAPPGMVFVPGGDFTMGSEDGDDEGPVRIVTLAAFWIDETEVTAAEYTECVTAGACVAPPMGNGYNYGVADRVSHPVNGVSWSGAAAYCAWVEGGVKRLPTEAEWEKAARGIDARTYPWGNMPEPSCTHVVMTDEAGIDGCGLGTTWAVGGKPLGASPCGALDMAGNAWEWVNDWYGPYDPAQTVDPMGPATGELRVLRGGAWGGSAPAYFRAADRFPGDPTGTASSVGFRCARGGA